ncbi:MAG: acyl-CoA dehydrogenase family protein [Nocardioidaceae bacterium]
MTVTSNHVDAQRRTPWEGNPLAEESERWDSIASDVAKELGRDALDRDRARRLPDAELALLKESGLADLMIPAEYGGQGGHWGTAVRVVRILARTDASIAQVLSYHYFNQASIVFFGDQSHWERRFTASARGHWLWGDSVNPVDPDLTLTPTEDGGYVLDGIKRFSTGAATGDVILVMGKVVGQDRVMAVIVSGGQEGITHIDDWDGLGQRLSVSGSVRFERVRVTAADVLGEVGDEPYSTMVTPGVQLGFANLYLGVAEGALARARELVLGRRGSWFLSGVEHYAHDPFVQRLLGELVSRTAALEALADRVGADYEAMIGRGGQVTEADRAEVAVAVARLKVVATETAIEVANRVFEATGSSSARSEIGLDLFWRNVRTHSLHDPVDYKKLEVGASFLNGTVQPISLYT